MSDRKLCPLPWVSIETSPFGELRPCCLYDDYIKKDDWLLFWGSDDWASSDYVIEKINSQISENYKKNFSPDLIVYSGEYINYASGKVKRKTF